MRIGDLPEDLVSKMVGEKPPASFECDGCTMAPDTWGGIDIRPACLYHDYAYDCGGDSRDRLEADRALYRNLRACDLGRFKAGIYYRRVRFWGMGHFAWFEGSEPAHPWLEKLRIFFTRWV